MSSSRPISPHRGTSRTDEDPSGLLHDLYNTPQSFSAPENTSNLVARRGKLPWWKRPHSVWAMIVLPLSIMAYAGSIAPRIEIYNEIACIAHRPNGTMTVGIRPARMPNAGASASIDNALVIPVLELLVEDKEIDCATDPVVQAAVAKIVATMITTTGTLDTVWAGWWGSWSDRHGRTFLIAIAALGAFSTDLILVLVSRLSPSHYWFLLVGAVMEGALGGIPSLAAAAMAYVADTTEPAERSSAFSLANGLLNLGVAIGPTLVSLLVRTTGNVLHVFVASCCMQAFVILFALLVMPESNTKEARLRAVTIHAEQMDAKGGKPRLRRLFSFLSPLAVFKPILSTDGKTRDWNLFLVAAAMGGFSFYGATTSYRIQYVESFFGWSLETVGYAITVISIARVVVLILLLPLLHKFIQSRRQAIELSPEDDKLVTLRLDLLLGRAFMLLETICHSLTVILPSPIAFSSASLVSTLSAPLTPISQSLALQLYTRGGGTESGKLFGASAVVEALNAQVAGPLIFGFVYASTVKVFPRAFLAVAAIALGLGCAALMMVRLPEDKVGDAEETPGEETPLLRA